MDVKPAAPAAKAAKAKPELLSEIDAIQTRWLTFAGKRNHNPFVAIKLDLDPLRKRVSDGETGAELESAIAALRDKDPVVVAAKVQLV